MAVRINKAAAENASIELNAGTTIKTLVVLLKVNNLSTLSVYSYKWLTIKPLWCQQVVGGYPSEC